MKQELALLKQTRQNIMSAIENLNQEQLNKIPARFNNNIIWNAAHLLVTQQMLCYKLSELEMNVSEEIINKFKKGSKPEGIINPQEIDWIKKQLLSNVSKIEEDLQKGLFKKYNAYTTSFGFALNNIEDAIKFNNLHEGLHFGYIMALKHIA